MGKRLPWRMAARPLRRRYHGVLTGMICPYFIDMTRRIFYIANAIAIACRLRREDE
jgi:hypothetical protein